MNRSDLPRIAAILRRAGDMLEAEGDRAWELSRDWATPLRSTSGGPAPKGSISDPTGTVAQARLEGREDVSSGYHAELERICTKVGPLAFDLRDLLRIITHQAEQEGRPTPTGAGDCRACGIYCSGADDDRIRSGYCPKDYRAFARLEGKVPRSDFERKVRKESAA